MKKTTKTAKRRDADQPRGFWGKAWYYFTDIMTFFVAMDGEDTHERESRRAPKPRATKKPQP